MNYKFMQVDGTLKSHMVVAEMDGDRMADFHDVSAGEAWVMATTFNARRAESEEVLTALQSALSWLGERPKESDLRWPYYQAKTELMDKIESAITQAKGQ